MKFQNWPLVRIFFRWFDSANSAIAGVIHAAKTQRHLRFHLSTAFIILLFCFVIGLEKIEFVIISIVTLMVISAEMFNTAVENLVDLLSPEKREAARFAKDVSAGAVLIVSVGAVVVGYLILWPYLGRIFSEGIHVHTHYPENIGVLSLIVIILIIVLLKAFSGRGLPLRGGMVSGHSAIAFSLMMSMLHLTTNLPVMIIVVALTIVIALSRLRGHIHSLREIVVGSLIGSLVTWILYKIFY